MIDSLPYGWEVVQIEQVADLINGYSQFNSKSYVDKGIPIFRIGDLGGQVHLSSVKRVSEAFVPNLNQKRLFRGDILIAKIGNRVGTSSVYNFDEPAILSSQVAGVRARRIDQKFLACFIESSFFYDAIKPHFFGSTRDNISPNHIRLTPIPFPPFPIQRKIAAVLSAYDDLIENNTRRIKILEEMASVIYREWFVEFRFPGHEQVEMVESELGLIPQGWVVKQLGDIVAEIIDYRGKTPKKLGGDWAESGIMALSAMNVKQGRLVNLEKAKFISEELYKIWMKSEIAKNDILMTSEAPLGEIYYLTEKKKICLSQRLFCIRANPNIIKPSLLFCAIDSPVIQGQLHASATGTTVLGIRQAALRKISVIVPPLRLQSKAESVLGTLITTKETLEKKNTNLRQTRDLLLPKLISGEIDVSKEENHVRMTAPYAEGLKLDNS